MLFVTQNAVCNREWMSILTYNYSDTPCIHPHFEGFPLIFDIFDAFITGMDSLWGLNPETTLNMLMDTRMHLHAHSYGVCELWNCFLIYVALLQAMAFQ